MPGLEDKKRSVLDQQEVRAKTYADFECGYMAYLGGGCEGDYEALCKGVTERFAASSEEIKKTEAELFEMGGSTERLSGWIRKLQEAEKEKLQLTIALQVERKRAKHMQEQRAHRSETLAKDVAESLEEEEEFVAEIQDNKLTWLKTQVDEIVVRINEAIDEIRYWETD